MHHVKVAWDFNNLTYRKEFRLNEQPITIGRNSQNDIVLNKPTISRFQGELLLDSEKLYYRNVSKNNMATVALGDRAHQIGPGQSIVLHIGSTVTIAGVTLVIENTTVPIDPDDAAPKVICPNCGRSLPAHFEECPYDGYSLAAAPTLVMDHDDLQKGADDGRSG